MSSDPVSTPEDIEGNGGARVEALPSARVESATATQRSGGSWPRRLFPLLFIAVAIGLSSLLFATRPEPVKNTAPLEIPIARVVVAQPADVQLSVVAHGTVTPRTESDVVAEVRGRIVEVSPALVAGGLFAEGDVLLRLDGRENRIAVDRARATLALRKSERQLAAADAERRRALAARGAASAADLEQFESRAAVASASVSEARAALAQAELDLERTTLRAPFDGRVRERMADLGQFVNPGTVLARIYATDYAEVRLPIHTDDLAHLDIPSGQAAKGMGLPVTLRADLGGRSLAWTAELVRSEGDIDLRTRMMNVVARVDDPQALLDPERTPLPAGLFVKAEITGREVDAAYALPLAALRDGDIVYVVGADDTLERRKVEVLRRTQSDVVVRSGLEAGERVIISALHAVTDGMRVQPLAVAAKRDAS